MGVGRTIHILMTFCSGLGVHKHLPGSFDCTWLYPSKPLKKYQEGKTTVIFIVCTSGGGRIHFINALIETESKWSNIQGKYRSCIKSASFHQLIPDAQLVALQQPL